MAKKVTYRDSGVDIDAGDAVVDTLKKLNPTIGGFGGLLPIPRGYKNPQLVLSTDGVGTKLLIAEELKMYDTIGIDLVAMVVNDILAMGARPIAFLDYYATAKLRAAEVGDILRGIHAGCEMARCPLVGGETAELPGVYPKNGFDLAGFGVGVVEKSEVITGKNIKPGDVVIGLPSSGIHSNGYSLARRVLLDGKNAAKGRKRREVMEEMLRPTSIYTGSVMKLLKKIRVKGIAHITGGGLPGNLVRVLPDGVKAVLEPGMWSRPEIFDRIQEEGPVDEAEMYRVFNMGIGLCIVVGRKQAEEAIRVLRRSMVHATQIGTIEKGRKKVVISGVEV